MGTGGAVLRGPARHKRRVRARPDHSALQPETRVNLEFAIPSWSACGPDLATPAQWQAWAGAPWLPEGAGTPPLTEVPPMMRRRLNGLGRTALQAAFDVHMPSPDVPVVFASRFGDAARSLELLGELARGDALSPTAFALSVHNAIGGVYSLVRGDHANYLAVAAGPATAAAALVEAAGLLADGAPEVLVVCCDGPLPEPYSAFEDRPGPVAAWAWRVTAPVAGQPRYTLQAGPADAPEPASLLPFDLDVLRFMVSGQPLLRRVVGTTTWTWRRFDA